MSMTRTVLISIPGVTKIERQHPFLVLPRWRGHGRDLWRAHVGMAAGGGLTQHHFICHQCGKTVISDSRRKYCSDECSILHWRPRAVPGFHYCFICRRCGRLTISNTRTIYCSYECQGYQQEVYSQVPLSRLENSLRCRGDIVLSEGETTTIYNTYTNEYRSYGKDIKPYYICHDFPCSVQLKRFREEDILRNEIGMAYHIYIDKHGKNESHFVTMVQLHCKIFACPICGKPARMDDKVYGYCSQGCKNVGMASLVRHYQEVI